MTVNRTTLLDLPLPVTGTESGTWGDITNNGLTEYMDIAIAGMSNLTSANFTAGALTIETTEGNSAGTSITATSAQYAGFRVSSLAANSTITVGNTGTSPARSYRLINADATYNLTFKATGQTGVTLLPGQSAVVAFNGTDYVIVGTVGAGTATDNAVARFDGTTGEILQNSAATIDDTGAATFVGSVNVSGTSASAADLKLYEDTDNGTNYVAFKSPASVASNVTWTLPSADGTNGQALTTNGSGTLAFSSVTTAPGGSDTQVQFNDSGSFGGDAGLTYNKTTDTLTTSVVVHGAGSAALPSITTTGDTNTGVYFPAADTAAITTGGSERMRVDSSGRVLINTTTSIGGNNKLQVVDDGTANIQIFTGRADQYGPQYVTGKSRGTTASPTIVQSNDDLGALVFRGYDGAAYINGAKIEAQVDATPGSNDMPGRLTFWTTADGSASATERMRITSAGNVGIATSTMTRNFNIGGTNAAVGMNLNNTGSSGRSYSIFSTNSGASVVGALGFYDDTASAYRMVIDSSGIVLIGTTTSTTGSNSQYSKFQVNGNNSSATDRGGQINLGHSAAATSITTGELIGGIYFTDTGAGEYGLISCQADGTAGTNDYPGRLLFYTTADGASSLTERMRIDSSGRVGINNTSMSSNPDQVAITAAPSSKYALHLDLASATAGAATVGALRIDGYQGRGQGTNTAISIDVYEIDVGTCYGVNAKVTGAYGNQYCVYQNLSKDLGAYTAAYCNYAYMATTNSGGTAYFYFAYDNNGAATRFYVLQNGGIGNYQANDANLSDRREKKDFAPAKNYLETICQIPVQTFKYIDQTDDEPTLGVVAQDVQAVAPELVTESNWAGENEDPKMRLSIYQTDLQYALMKCIQELKSIVDAQAARIAALEGTQP